MALVSSDPSYDIIQHMMDIGPKTMWRNGRPYDVAVPEGYVTAGAPIDGRFLRALPQRAPKIGVSWPGNLGTHWGFCVPTDTLRSMRGYDERFLKYGPEDSDLIRRLKRLGNQFKYDDTVFALHIHHELETGGNEEMTDLARRIAREPATRNDPDTWGEGGRQPVFQGRCSQKPQFRPGDPVFGPGASIGHKAAGFVANGARIVSGPAPAGTLTFKPAKSEHGNGSLDVVFLTELAATFHLGTFVETGTFLGGTVAAAIPVFDEIHTIELSPELAQRAARRFESVATVHVHQGDSADRLAEILERIPGAPLIWLDGHYSEGVTARGRGNTPVIDELESIDRSGISGAVILIDDLRLFDVRAPQAGDPESLGGYPSLQTLSTLVASMKQKYQLFAYGDVALILPADAGVRVSPQVEALTISRLYDGSNMPIDEVLDAEEVIATTKGPEREALRQLAGSSSVRATERYGLGLHYRFWEGLASRSENPGAAEAELTAAMRLGFAHWRARWHLARACALLGKTFEMRRLLNAVLDENPGFAPANVMLGSHELAGAGEGDLGKLKAAGLWREGQPLRLHLGCGEQHFDGYVNIDHPAEQHNVMTVTADYQADITQLDFPPQSVDEIRLHHVFEHFNRVTALAMLITWQQWLKLGGKLYIETPDLMGSAAILVSDVPWAVKMGTVRHLAGDQAASWAYHVDHWFPERYQHTLQRLGFGQVQAGTSRWPQPPYLCNVHAIGIKTEHLSPDQLLAAADALLWESTVAPAEQPTHAVWTRQLRAVLKHTPCGPGNIHVSDVGVEPAAPRPTPAVVAPVPQTIAPASPIPPTVVVPLVDIHDFNQRGRDRWVEAKAATVPKGSRVLDMGAGTCLYRPLFAHCEYKTHDFKRYEGAEKHGGTSAYGRIDYVSEILAIPAPDASFDVVLCTEVLEHVPEPIKVLKEISRLLRPGGRAFITAPLGSGLHQLPFHFYGGYTPEWYRRFSHEAGMEATEITPNGGFFKHLAQECARAGGIYRQNPQLHGAGGAELCNLLLDNLPRLLFGLDDTLFDERFTVGFFVEAVKNPAKGGATVLVETPAPARSAATMPVVVTLMGGLGNQMFQYAAGLALASKNTAPLHLDLTFLLDKSAGANFTQREYGLDVFPLHPGCELIRDTRTMPGGLTAVTEKTFSYDPSVMALPAGTRLRGYWQSPRYFEGLETEIKSGFALAPTLTNAEEHWAAEIEESAAVCLHVRRGDMVHNASTASYHGSCTREYYQAASDVMVRRFPNAHFYIFSDEPDWCRANDLTRGRPQTIVHHGGKAEDSAAGHLYLMQRCQHFIIANSTFSWWAAYLGDRPGKTVIAPQPWFSSTDLDSLDLLPAEWIRLSRDPDPVVSESRPSPQFP